MFALDPQDHRGRPSRAAVRVSPGGSGAPLSWHPLAEVRYGASLGAVPNRAPSAASGQPNFSPARPTRDGTSAAAKRKVCQRRVKSASNCDLCGTYCGQRQWFESVGMQRTQPCVATGAPISNGINTSAVTTHKSCHWICRSNKQIRQRVANSQQPSNRVRRKYRRLRPKYLVQAVGPFCAFCGK